MCIHWKPPVAIATCLLLSGSLLVFGEVPNQSKKQLQEHASHAFRGKVVQTYERAKDPDAWQTDCIAEIVVERIEQGSEVAPGDRVFVHYWRRRLKLDETGSTGHRDVPSAGESVLVYVKGDRKTGYDVLLPNGFVKVEKSASKK